MHLNFKRSSSLQLVVTSLLIASCTAAVKLAGDWIGNVRELLFLLLEIFGGGSGSVLVQP
jgi:hypothetical protein